MLIAKHSALLSHVSAFPSPPKAFLAYSVQVSAQDILSISDKPASSEQSLPSYQLVHVWALEALHRPDWSLHWPNTSLGCYVHDVLLLAEASEAVAS